MSGWERIRALEVLEDLLEAGVHVEPRRPHLYVEPADRLTTHLEQRVRAVKPELLDVLDPPPPEGPCAKCGAVNLVRRPAGRWRCLECWDVEAEEAAEYFFGPLSWHQEEMPA